MVPPSDEHQAPAPAPGRPPGGAPPAAAPTNLPAPALPLIGREREIAAATAVLRQPLGRLLTLTGPGGADKTRLAQAIAARLRDACTDGVWFVPLAAVPAADLVDDAIAGVLDVKEAAPGALAMSLQAYLRDKRLLLVLDHFEHVAAAAPLVAGLLAAAPGVKILVTSRVVLGLAGEQEFGVPPLGLPDLQHLPPLADLAQYPAIALFSARAGAVQPAFALTAANAAAVAEICTWLDGLPLAIELAASGSAGLAPEAIRDQLARRLPPESAGPLDPHRQQEVLRAVIAWSWEHLPTAEQALFARLSVFAGGCPAEAATTVAGATPAGLATLAARNLLDVQHTEAGRRYAMLESIRAFAEECLAARGEAATWQDRYVGYYLDLVETAEPELRGAQQGAWLTRLEEEHDNLSAALRWALAHRAAGTAQRLSGALWRFWWLRGYVGEGARWLEAVLALPGEESGPALPPGAARAKVLHGAGVIADALGDHEGAKIHYKEALALRRRTGDREGITILLNNLGHTALLQGDYAEASAFLEEALLIARAGTERWGLALVLSNLWHVALERGDPVRARVLLQESLALRRDLRDTRGIAGSSLGLGLVAMRQGDYPAAAAALQESLRGYQELHDRAGIADVTTHLGYLAEAQGHYAEATALYQQSLALARELNDQDAVAVALCSLGLVAQAAGAPQQAAAYFTASLRQHQELGRKPGIAECLAGLAGVAETQGRSEHAARMFGAAERLLDTLGTRVDTLDSAEYKHSLTVARIRLSQAGQRAAWAAGAALPLDAAVAEALAPPPGPPLPPETASPPAPVPPAGAEEAAQRGRS